MSDKKLKFGDKEISKKEFYGNKKPFEIDNVDVKRLYDSKKKSYKYYIVHDDNDTIRPILVELP